MSKKAFCAGQGISYQRFYYWHKQYKDSNRLPAASPAFIPLSLPPDPAPAAELIYPDGKKLLLYQNVDAGFLKALLS